MMLFIKSCPTLQSSHGPDTVLPLLVLEPAVRAELRNELLVLRAVVRGQVEEHGQLSGLDQVVGCALREPLE